jgi:hypothetical protein
MNLIMLSDYIKALNSTRKLPTNNEHFPMHILFFYHLFTAELESKSNN